MQNRVPPLLTEVVVGGFWLGATIKVAGYTWESVSSTWSALPPPGSGGGPAVPPPKAVKAADKAIGLPNLPANVPGVAASPVVNPLQGVVNKVTKVIGGLIP